MNCRNFRVGILILVSLAGCGEQNKPETTEPEQVVEPIAEQDKTSFETSLKKKKEEIEAEIKALGPAHPWAGSYRTPIAHVGFTLLFAPKAGFIVQSHCCLGSGIGYGTVEEDGKALRLKLQAYRNYRENPVQRVEHLKEVVPYLWENQHYMVARSSLGKVKREIESNPEPQGLEIGSYLLREGDKKMPAR